MARKLIERLTDAVTELRDPLPTKMLGDIETKSIEDRPDFGRNTYDFNYQTSWRGRLGYGLGYDSANAHRREIGDLDNSSLVMAVCNDTGISLAEAEPSVRRPNSKGQMEPIPGHPLAELISNPNPYHIWEDYCLAGAFSYWADGNWYMQEVRDNGGQLTELWYLPHFMVEPRWPGDGRSPAVPTDAKTEQFLSHYQYSVPGKVPVLIPASDMVHLKRGVRLDNPRKGVGAFESVITEIYGDKKAALFSATVLKNLGIIVPLVSPKDKDTTISETDAKAIKERWAAGTTGDRAGELMVNPVALDVTKFAFSPKELDLKELRMVPESRIAAVTRYPAAYLQFLVGLQNGTSYASYKEAREQAYESVIIPIQNGIARRFTQRLVPEFDKDPGAQFFFDTSKVRVLQEDRDALYKRESEALRAGGITINQFLQSIGKEPIPDGEIYLIPSLSTPMTVEKLRERAADMTPPPTTPPIDPTSLAKFMDIDRILADMEEQMRGFQPK